MEGTTAGQLVQPSAESRISYEVRPGCSGFYPDGSLKQPSNKGGDHPASLGNLCYCLTAMLEMGCGFTHTPLASSYFNLCFLPLLLTEDRRSNGEINKAGTEAEGPQSPLPPSLPRGGGAGSRRRFSTLESGRGAPRDGLDGGGSGRVFLPPTDTHFLLIP